MDNRIGHQPGCRESFRRRGDGAHAFSLIELLIVMSIALILAGILLPVVDRSRRSAQQALCQNNLRNLLAATAVYATDNEEQFPFGYYIDAQLSNRGLTVALGNYLDGAGVLACPTDPEAIPQESEMFWALGWATEPPPPGFRSYQFNHWVFRNRWVFENRFVTPCNTAQLRQESNLIVFYDGTAAPTDTPAISWEVMQARHVGDNCNLAFADGHAGSLPMQPAGLYKPPTTADPFFFGKVVARYIVDPADVGALPIYNAGSDAFPSTPGVYHPGQDHHGQTAPGYGAAVFGPPRDGAL